MTRPVVGILVGGRSSRMGQPKGRLTAPGSSETLIERLVRVAREAGLEPWLVGDAEAYADLVPDVPRLPDDPPGVGPLGGIRALLGRAPVAIAVACDMPAVDASVLERLARAPAAPVVASRHERWEPLCARYEASALPAIDRALDRGDHSLQPLLDELGTPIDLASSTLIDWDHPSDLDR